MPTRQNFGLKCKNYKCFGDEMCGFDEIELVNLIIGKNNSGKSSLVEIVQKAVGKEVLDSKDKRKGYKSGVYLEKVLTKDMIDSFPLDDTKRWLQEKEGAIIHFDVTGNATKFHEISGKKNYPKNFPSQIERFSLNDFFKKQLVEISAERNISPEPKQGIGVEPNGNGATNLIRDFLNADELDSALVEKQLLNELNTIFQPDAEYTRIRVQERRDNSWEVYLDEKNKGSVRLSASGNGLKTIMLVLVKLMLVPKHPDSRKQALCDYIFIFEELENNLHPAQQRRLFHYIYQKAIQEQFYVFFTSHSHIAIDLLNGREHCQILHVAHDGTNARVTTVVSNNDCKEILYDIGVKASDILQSNGVIWVEGPSDRVYINRWLEIWSDGKLKEGFHYQCLFYGGKILSHYSSNDNGSSEDERVAILKTNPNTIIVMDSDKKSEEENINDTKQRICKEFESDVRFGFAWVTEGREIENYISHDVYKEYFTKHLLNEININDITAIDKFESFKNYIDRYDSQITKVQFARDINSFFTKNSIEGCFNLAENVEKMCEWICKWNGISLS